MAHQKVKVVPVRVLSFVCFFFKHTLVHNPHVPAVTAESCPSVYKSVARVEKQRVPQTDSSATQFNRRLKQKII